MCGHLTILISSTKTEEIIIHLLGVLPFAYIKKNHTNVMLTFNIEIDTLFEPSGDFLLKYFVAKSNK